MSDYIEYKVRVYKDGTKEWRWYLNDELHREDGPAVEWANGTKEWRLQGVRHREDGPAVEYPDGDKRWYLDGKLHREDGPAIEWADGDEWWYLKDVKYTKSDYKAEMEKTNTTCEVKTITIEGKEYTLTEVK